VLAVGLVLMLVFDLLLLRREFRPLQRLASVMRAVDLTLPRSHTTVQPS